MSNFFGPEKEVQGDLEVALLEYELLSRALLQDLERSGVSRFRFGEVFETSLGSKIDQKSIQISSLNLMRLPTQPNLDFWRMSAAKCSFLKLKGEPKTLPGNHFGEKNHSEQASKIFIEFDWHWQRP